jgi:hypothetical protein
MFLHIWPSSIVKIVVFWKVQFPLAQPQSLYMWSRLCASVSHSDGPFFLLCCVYPILMGRSCCCVLCVCMWSVCALVYPILMGRSSCCSCCVVCMWSRLCASVSSSDRPFFLLCCVYPILKGRSCCCVLCVCMWSHLYASVSHSDPPFFL